MPQRKGAKDIMGAIKTEEQTLPTFKDQVAEESVPTATGVLVDGSLLAGGQGESRTVTAHILLAYDDNLDVETGPTNVVNSLGPRDRGGERSNRNTTSIPNKNEHLASNAEEASNDKDTSKLQAPCGGKQHFVWAFVLFILVVIVVSIVIGVSKGGGASDSDLLPSPSLPSPAANPRPDAPNSTIAPVTPSTTPEPDTPSPSISLVSASPTSILMAPSLPTTPSPVSPPPTPIPVVPPVPTVSGQSWGNCGGGDIGNGICKDLNICCSIFGWCQWDLSLCENPACGNGTVGDGVCADIGKCCSLDGFCHDCNCCDANGFCDPACSTGY